MTTADNQDK